MKPGQAGLDDDHLPCDPVISHVCLPSAICPLGGSGLDTDDKRRVRHSTVLWATYPMNRYMATICTESRASADCREAGAVGVSLPCQESRKDPRTTLIG